MGQLVQLQIDDLGDRLTGERLEDDDLVEPVQELRLELVAQLFQYALLHLVVLVLERFGAFHLESEIGRLLELRGAHV